MKKRIVICADGTWNRPGKNLKKDFPTNVLRLARAIKPLANDGSPQQVFYDWGVGYKPGEDGSLADNALGWMIDEAEKSGLNIEEHLEKEVQKKPLATLHKSRRSFYRVKKKYFREIDHKLGSVLIHESVKIRWEQDKKYRPDNLVDYINAFGWPENLIRN